MQPLLGDDDLHHQPGHQQIARYGIFQRCIDQHFDHAGVTALILAVNRFAEQPQQRVQNQQRDNREEADVAE